MISKQFETVPRLSFLKCPRCKSDTRVCETIAGTNSKFWRRCVHCRTFIDTYIPQPHQAEFHADSHRYKGNFGGYGSGKTLTDQKEIAKHIFLTENANVLIGANISSQYEQTVKREMENDLPKEFIAKSSVKDAYYDFQNGARLMFRPFDDPGKLRSLNLSMFLVIEGSETNNEVYTQLKTRLRNDVAVMYKLDDNGEREILKDEHGEPILDEYGNPQFIILHDWREGIVESNPDSGYIRSSILLPAERKVQFGFNENYDVSGVFQDPMTSAYVTATLANRYLPSDYIKSFDDKPEWWRRRYLFGSFQYAEGLVYPNYSDTIVPYFQPEDHWLRAIAFDYGLSDKAVYLFGAIDPVGGTIYIYKEIVVENMDIDKLSNLYHEGVKDFPAGAMAFPPLIDPKSGPKRDYQKKSLIDHFLERGIYFEPGTVSVETRVLQTSTYINSGRVKIMDNCTHLISELREYKYPEKSLDKVKANENKPVDKNNHAINPLEWILTRLPKNPKDMLKGIYNQEGIEYTGSRAVKNEPMWQLSDTSWDSSSNDGFMTPSFGIYDLSDM